MLLRAASDYSGLEPSAFRKARTAGGKPYFPDAPQVRFSISHSGDYWACAFGPSEVGLDVQKHENRRYRDISRRFFHPVEIEHLQSCCYDPAEFFKIWTAKESYVKFTGGGIMQGLAAFSVLSPIEGAQLRHVQFKEGYSMCICAERVGEVLLKMEN